ALGGGSERGDSHRAAPGDPGRDRRQIAGAIVGVPARSADGVESRAAVPAREAGPGARLEDPQVSGQPEPARPAEGRPVEDVTDERRAAERTLVAPDLGLTEAVAGRLIVDRHRLSLADDHPPGVAVDPVVVGRRDVPEVLVAELISRPQGRRQAVSLAPLPEVFLEGFALIGSRQE